NSDCTKGYWVEFSVNATNPSSKSWWIEIPFENQLGTLDMTSLCDIAGIAEDYSEDIKVSWAINSAMDEQSDISFVLSKEEVEELDLSGINQMMERYFRTKDLLISNRNKTVFWIFGYDDDSRELYEIPEVRRWFKFTLEQGVPWFYLLDVGADHMSLPINMYSCCNISVNKLSCGSKSVVISSVSDINNWVEVNFENLNRFADEKKIPDNILKEVSEKVITSVHRLVAG
ncbi:TPA: chlororespiratory reduction 6 domain-containing protein, partial [Vibrio cholerae]|nr:chlororespiratory reduction 6 domain-containing protein [Vibrio cholerae]